LKARQLAADWEVRQRQTKLEKSALRRQREVSKCEGYCRELRQVLRQREDLVAQAREMYELDVRPVQPKLATEARGKLARERTLITDNPM